MPEYEVNLSSPSGSNLRQVRLPAASPDLALLYARQSAGPGFDVLVSVNEVTLTPVLLGEPIPALASDGPEVAASGLGAAEPDSGALGGQSGQSGAQGAALAPPAPDSLL